MSRKNTNDTLLGTITCSTRYSPPMHVIWYRDGVRVALDGDRYEMIQSVTDRRSSSYDSVLLIRDAVGHAGNHTYTCWIGNYVGRDAKNTSTTMTGKSHLP